MALLVIYFDFLIAYSVLIILSALLNHFGNNKHVKKISGIAGPYMNNLSNVVKAILEFMVDLFKVIAEESENLNKLLFGKNITVNIVEDVNAIAEYDQDDRDDIVENIINEIDQTNNEDNNANNIMSDFSELLKKNE